MDWLRQRSGVRLGLMRVEQPIRHVPKLRNSEAARIVRDHKLSALCGSLKWLSIYERRHLTLACLVKTLPLLTEGERTS